MKPHSGKYKGIVLNTTDPLLLIQNKKVILQSLGISKKTQLNFLPKNAYPIT
jgi:hypothetical protein